MAKLTKKEIIRELDFDNPLSYLTCIAGVFSLLILFITFVMLMIYAFGFGDICASDIAEAGRFSLYTLSASTLLAIITYIYTYLTADLYIEK